MPIESSELSALKILSAKLGQDISLVQAASGNTSLKTDCMLWIKASGKWLADAMREEIFVPVSSGGPATDEHSEEHADLRPSIETAMHACLPHRVVIHVHSINAISWAVREDGAEQVAPRLNGLAWAWIPYVPSGMPLAREIQRCLNRGCDVFVMANHGLVVAASDCAAAESLLGDVERRLVTVPRKAPGPDRPYLECLARGSGWYAPAEAVVHELATDPDSLAIFAAGTLYPCQGLFLGEATAVCGPSETLEAALERYWLQHGREPGAVAVEGKGLLVPPGITIPQMQVLVGLALVIQRLGPESTIRYLTQPEIAELLNIDAYQYRKNVEARTALTLSA